jgi:hypothetical protein
MPAPTHRFILHIPEAQDSVDIAFVSASNDDGALREGFRVVGDIECERIRLSYIDDARFPDDDYVEPFFTVDCFESGSHHEEDA